MHWALGTVMTLNRDTHAHWSLFVPFFESRGYGLVIPDMLGYGDTAKPINPAEYIPSKMSKDLVDLLDAEGVQQAIAVGFDWYVPK